MSNYQEMIEQQAKIIGELIDQVTEQSELIKAYKVFETAADNNIKALQNVIDAQEELINKYKEIVGV